MTKTTKTAVKKATTTKPVAKKATTTKTTATKKTTTKAFDISKQFGTVKDFPEKGVTFRDISPILADPKVFTSIIDEIAKETKGIDLVVGPDARGFLFAAPVAIKAKKPMIMVRKPGKIPGKTIQQEYVLEYGTNTLQVQVGAIKKGQKIIIVDDILATGGTAMAIIQLAERIGAKVVKAVFVGEISALGGRKLLEKHIKVVSLATFK